MVVYFSNVLLKLWAAAMHLNPLEAPTQPVIYPDSDGQPMADNTKQFRWIMTLVGGLEALFADDPTVFVAGDLLWYPVEGDNKTRIAPDALVVFGRPKGDRGSYKQWEENGLAPQVVFEVLSPGNTKKELANKLAFYDRYGVEEYYLYDPDNGRLQGWRRQAGRLLEIASMRSWISPRLQVQFDLEGVDLCLTRPDGRRFDNYLEVFQRAESAELRAEHAESRAGHAESRAGHAESRAEYAESRAEYAELQAEHEARRAEHEAQRAAVAESELARLRALLKHQGMDISGSPEN